MKMVILKCHKLIRAYENFKHDLYFQQYQQSAINQSINIASALNLFTKFLDIYKSHDLVMMVY